MRVMSGGDDDDLWAPTRPDGGQPSEPDTAPGSTGATDATGGATERTSPAPGPDPTRVQPAIRMGLGSPADVDGSGVPDDTRPRWLVPAAIGLAVVLVGGLFVAFATGGDEDDDTAPPDASTSTSLSATTAPESVTGSTITSSDAAATNDDAVDASTTVDPTASTTADTSASTDPTDSTDDGSSNDEGTGGSTDGGTSDGSSDASGDQDAGPTTTPSEPTVASTAPPATAPDGADEPGAAPPEPGFAAYGDERLAVDSACGEFPLGPDGDEVSSFLVRSAADGRVVVEQRTAGDQVSMDVWYPDTGEIVVADGVQTVDGATSGSITRNGTTLDVAVGIPPGGVEECLDFFELLPSNDVDGRGYTAGILDVCAVDTPAGRAISGIATDDTSFTVVPNGDTTRLTIVVPSLGGTLVDDDALADQDETIVFYEGVVTGAGEPQAAYLEVELAAPRVCAANEAP